MRQWTVDAFAPAPFKGNPACVTEPLAAWRDDAWMQRLAMENNQAETAFLIRTDDPARFGLRWFTPALEVPLCGHATLASGHTLFSELGVKADEIVFDTKSGELRVKRTDGGYEMDFPAQTARPIKTPPGLAEALGAAPLEVLSCRFLLAVLPDEATVRALDPDLTALEEIAAPHTEGGKGNVFVTALGDRGGPYDLVSRYFAPGSGIPEDPATGSAHCVLTPLFAKRLGRRILHCHQAYPGRGGDLTCEDRGDRVLLRGSAFTVLESNLRL